MAFSNCSRFLIAASVAEEGSLAIIDVQQGIIVENGTAILRELSVNKIVVNPSNDSVVDIDFVTVGQRGSFAVWQYDHKTQRIMQIIPDMNSDLQHTDFTSATFTPKLSAPYNSEIVMLGTADGCVVAMNPNPKEGRWEWVEHGKKEQIFAAGVSQIVYRHAQVVIASSVGLMIRYADKHA